jgi:hypothetical protein
MPVQSVGGNNPMLVHGVAKLDFKCTFRSKLSYDIRFISGVTKDSAGAILGYCTVNLFDSPTNTLVQTIISDANGKYSFQVQPGKTFYIVAYKAGSPDVSGTTVNNLTGV